MSWIKKNYGKILSATWKPFKIKYYLVNYSSLYWYGIFRPSTLKRLLKKIAKYDKAYIEQRVAYYNQLKEKFTLSEGVALKDFAYQSYCKNYFFDTFRVTKYFPRGNRIRYEFGDVTQVADEPTLVKSRPINKPNTNSVLLKLNEVRHFVFVNDRRKFTDKQFKVLWRGNIQKHQQNRIDLLAKFHDHSLCDIAYVNDAPFLPYEKGNKLTFYEQLDYQFILSLEGNDVATNLKWIMSSNSIAVMPKPKYETWFMEGTLIPDYHYILIKDDFSDLLEKITYYHTHPTAAEAIVRNAQAYVKQFKNKEREKLISLLVLQKYFDLQE